MDPETKERALDLRDRGVALAQDGDRDGALAQLRQSAELNPNDQVTLLWIARCLVDPEQRRTALGRVLALNPGNADALEELQKVSSYFQAGPPPAAPAPAPVFSAPDAPARATPVVIPQKKSKALPLLLAIVVIVVGGLVALGSGGGKKTGTPSIDAPPAWLYTVVYEVKAEGGKADVGVVYRNRGEVVRHGDRDTLFVQTDWRQATQARAGDVVSLTGEKKSGAGRVRCTITVDGKEVAAAVQDEDGFFQCRATAR